MSKIYESETAAATYDSSRGLPEETKTLWMNVIAELVPRGSMTRILDLGGGTGRFSSLIEQFYGCAVTTADPSIEMLKQGLSRNKTNISQIASKAECLPFKSCCFDLVFLSQVFHHIEDMKQAFTEIFRVLSLRGDLLIRNSTLESAREIGWQTCFPSMVNVEPYRQDIIDTVSRYGFYQESIQMVNQIFAASYDEYFDKISQRGLSPLIAMADNEFEAGLIKFRKWVDSKPPKTPVFDPVDIFHFKKR